MVTKQILVIHNQLLGNSKHVIVCDWKLIIDLLL